MDEIKKGDVVELKCGGPRMVVFEVYTGRVACAWITKAGTPNKTSIPVECVQRAPLP